MDEAKIEDLGKKLTLAKKQPLNFAFAPGSGKNDGACQMDRKLPLNKLRQNVKKASGNNKTICGVANVSGKMLSLSCEEVPARPLVKGLKKFLIELKLKHKIQILDADGTVVIADDEDEAEATSTGGTPGVEAKADVPDDSLPSADGLEDLKQKFAVVSRQTKLVIEQSPEREKALSSALEAIEKLLDAGEADKVRAGMARLAAALKQQPGAKRSGTNGKAVSASVKKLLKLRSDIDTSYAQLLAALSKHSDARVRKIASDGYQKIFGGAGGVLSGADAELFGAVETWNASTAEARQAAEGDIKRCIEQLKTHLAGNEFIRLIENNPFGASLQISQPLNSVLSEIDSQIAA
ncbi:MAG: hypothetical protein AB3N21_06280 [Ruegeria sp.]|uniref:hypothetical protein n=1 Tax=Ruegeria sp. TaxID=1879320 RepID=UPI00349E555E